MADITVPSSLLIPPRKTDGMTSQQKALYAELFEMRAEASSLGIIGQPQSDGSVKYAGISNYDLFAFDEAQTLATLGCTVVDYPMVLEIDDNTDDVPDGIPHRMEPANLDATPPTSERVRTWDEWSIATGVPAVQYGGKWYVTSDRKTFKLTVAEITVAEDDGVTLKTETEYRAIVAANSPS